MTTREILIAARALIARGWTQGAVARDANGNDLESVRDPRACSWCLFGALLVVTDCEPTDWEPAYAALGEHAPAWAGGISFNEADERTQEDVLNLYDRAIEACP